MAMSAAPGLHQMAVAATRTFAVKPCLVHRNPYAREAVPVPLFHQVWIWFLKSAAAHGPSRGFSKPKILR